MSSWVQLLLVLLVVWSRFGLSEGDALPAALVELVRNSPISSIEDLHLLLLSDSVDEEDGTSAANGGHRLPRSLDAQPAQQALCKVRTEVVEVTRGMLDRSNANFLLWPPCVEVQRCSGCCNTKSLQCVPVITHTRYLQVMKIEYINKRPTYAKAVVSVVDHVECRCQPAPRPPAHKKKSSRRHHTHLHQNQTLHQGPARGQVKVHSKDELHQLDELKQNQRAHLEDLLEHHWNPRGDTFTQPEEGFSLAEKDMSQPGEDLLFPPHWLINSSRLFGTEDDTEKQVSAEWKEVTEDNKAVSSVGNNDQEVKRKSAEDEDAQTHNPMWREDKSKFSKSENNRLFQYVTDSPQVQFSPEETVIEKESRSRPTKEPNPDPRGQVRHRENDTPEIVRMLQMEEERLEAEKKELLLLHKKLDQEKEILRQQQMKREEEEKLKTRETESQHHLHGRHQQHQQHLTTEKPETTTSTTTTRPPSTPTGPRLPARPHQARRRLRKNRKRLSKAAMRAMLM